jgi:hypothetical protein
MKAFRLKHFFIILSFFMMLSVPILADTESPGSAATDFAASLYRAGDIPEKILNTLHHTIVSGDRDLSAAEMKELLNHARGVIATLDQPFRLTLKNLKWKVEAQTKKDSINIRGYFHSLRFFDPEDTVVILRPLLKEEDKDKLEAINFYASKLIFVLRPMDRRYKIIGFSAEL